MPRLLVRRLLFVLALVAAMASVIRPASIGAQADARERTLFVSAVDDNGEPVEDLRINDVIVREDGARREVLRVSRAVEPMDIALLVDDSAAAESAVVPMRAALRMFVAAMAEGNQIAVITLADRPTVRVEYTSNLRQLESGVGSVFAQSNSGMTLLDAIFEATRGLLRRETPRAAIVAVINDGPEFTNRHHRQVVDAVKEAGAQLHAVTVGNFYAGGNNEVRERDFLLDIGTKESGGQRIALLSPLGLETALGKLARELRRQYKVVYGRPQSLIPPEKLEVTSPRAGVTVRGTPMRGQPGA